MRAHHGKWLLAASALLWAVARAEPFVMLMKSVSRVEAVYGEAIEVELRLFNKGDAPAYSLAVADPDWSTAKFELVKGKKETSVDALGANENITHTCAPRRARVRPCSRAAHHAASRRHAGRHVRPRPAPRPVANRFTLRPVFSGMHTPVSATVSYAAAKGGKSVTHTSNAPPQMTVLSRGQKYLKWALAVGRVLSLNFVRTARGWAMVTLSWMGLFGLVGLFKLQQKMRVWRHERAIAEMEKMK